MTWTSAPLRRLTQLLLCAMLLAALAPTLSRARAWGQGSAAPWMEICTAQGTQSLGVDVTLDALTDERPQPGKTMVDHCAFCLLVSERMAPPSSPFAWQALPQAPPPLAHFGPHLPPSILHWTVLTRAPPAHA